MTTHILVLRLDTPKKLNDEFFAKDAPFVSFLFDLSKQDAFHDGYWGLEDEDAANLRIFVNYVEDIREEKTHIAVTKQIEKLSQVKNVENLYVAFEPTLPTEPLNPSVSFNTMVETIYFDHEFPHADGWEHNFKRKVENILRENGDAFKAAAGGWGTMQNAVVPGTDEPCKLWFALVGWPSMKAHLEWRESPSHAENQKLLEQYKDWWKGIVRVHCSMNRIEATRAVPKVQGERKDSPFEGSE